ncbi:UNVERIFIED_CONTAM: Cyclic nucleotide-binding domain-containing protein [Acetivibrio alkalicellulosi]
MVVLGNILNFKSNDFIYLKNSSALNCYLLNKGQVVLLHKGLADIIIEPGNLFGLYSLINGSLRRESALAITNCEVCEISRNDLKSLIINRKINPKNLMVQLISLCKLANKCLDTASLETTSTPEIIYNAVIYYTNNGHKRNVYKLIDIFKTSYSSSEFYQKALRILKDKGWSV